MTQQYRPGWYPQPDGSQRFHDGNQWTDQVSPAAAPSPTAASQAAQPPGQVAPTAKKPWFKKKRVIIPVAALVAILALATTQGKGGAGSAAPALTASAQAPAAASQSPTVDPVEEPSADAEEPSEEPVDEPSEEPAEEPSMTVSQEQAVSKAESYLDYTAFSRSGLIKQLKFEGFSTKDGTFAVDHVEVDWMEQAALKAKSYLEYTSFSRSGLIKQLEFEGFTPKQARHGVKAVGL